MTNVLIIQLKWDLKITPFLKEKVELLFCRLRTPGPVEFTLLETTSKYHREHFSSSNVIQDSNTKICFKLFTIPLYTSIKMKKHNVKKLSIENSRVPRHSDFWHIGKQTKCYESIIEKFRYNDFERSFKFIYFQFSQHRKY